MLRAIFARLDSLLAEHGAYLDDTYVCPHHPERGFPNEVRELKVLCTCRKPSPGMLEKAALAHGIDLPRSWLIGDRQVDVKAAHSVGAKAVLLTTGSAPDSTDEDVAPDVTASTLPEAVDHILGVIK
jgi:histidinol-phosphate phosphatase family protein